MNELTVYENQGYEQNLPDYVFNNLEFIGTCGACPEQYDVILAKDGKRYQVGYVRLRGGRLSGDCPDCGGDQVYFCSFEDGWKGQFDDEIERLEHLEKIAASIQDWLKGECKKTDKEKFIALMQQFNIQFSKSEGGNTLFIEVGDYWGNVENTTVDGYSGFFCSYEFTPEGEFIKMFIGE